MAVSSERLKFLYDAVAITLTERFGTEAFALEQRGVSMGKPVNPRFIFHWLDDAKPLKGGDRVFVETQFTKPKIVEAHVASYIVERRPGSRRKSRRMIKVPQ
ncbi:MAG: hypothetical protein SFW62_02765 [Alphaproteobacteria bacterium]|nr:hypothetical protein [Alphaproteobacteria bacterium]